MYTMTNAELSEAIQATYQLRYSNTSGGNCFMLITIQNHFEALLAEQQKRAETRD